jgi:hypothetical protein
MQRRVVIWVAIVLVVVVALIVLFGDGGRASRQAEQQQAALDASLDKYDRMSMSQLTVECQRICLGDRPDAAISTAERAACVQTCLSARDNTNEAAFRNFVREYANESSVK